ncbi:MAG TPA: aminoglycoside phosphotransferase family protein [Pyrinomonadaceae bacterium]|nr:aminoglycoside phosphotransferase family protein [Pyrinomonadaceae bacterium]
MNYFPQIQTKEDFEANFHSKIWLEAAKEICRKHRVSFDKIKRAGGSEHIVFLIDEKFVLKIYKPFRNCFERETKSLEFVGGKTDFVIPEIVYTGEFENFPYVLMTQLAGDSMTRADWLKIPEKVQSEFISKLAVGLKQIHALSAESFENDWAEFVKDRAEKFIERQIAHGVNKRVLKALPKYIEENLSLVPINEKAVFMHADVHFGNLRVLNSNGKLQVAGLFDFADSRVGFHEYEFLAIGVLMIQGQGNLQREFLKSYGYAEKDLDEKMRKRLMMLTMLYETADLRRYAMRLKPEAVEFSLDELERGIWSFAK